MSTVLVVNFDELGKYLGEGIKIDIESIDLESLGNLLTGNFEQIIELLNELMQKTYIQKSKSLTFDIPAIQSDYEKTIVFDNSCRLTGICFSQTGWKDSDCFSLYLDNELIFDKIYTKEMGQYKHFNGHNRCSELKIVYHSNSGNSKLVWFDVDYLEKK